MQFKLLNDYHISNSYDLYGQEYYHLALASCTFLSTNTSNNKNKRSQFLPRIFIKGSLNDKLS